MSKPEIETFELKKPDIEIKWTVHEWIGAEVHAVDENGAMAEEPLRGQDDLKIGMVIAMPGWGVRAVVTDLPPHAAARAGSNVCFLEFGQDARNCWVCGGMASQRAIDLFVRMEADAGR